MPSVAVADLEQGHRHLDRPQALLGSVKVPDRRGERVQVARRRITGVDRARGA
jgi:hypothetical protein